MARKKIPATTADPKAWISHVDLKELRECPETLQLLCQEIRDFAYTPAAKDIDAFCRAYRIRPSKLWEWRQELPALNEAMNELQEQVHVYRRILWADRLIAENNFLRYAHLNCAKEKEIDKYHDARKKEIQQGESPHKIEVTVTRDGIIQTKTIEPTITENKDG